MILKSIHLPLFIISFLCIGCLGVEKSSETETSSSDTITTETDSTTVTVRVLLGTIAIDSIHVALSVESSTQTLPISYGSQISGEASFTFSIPSSSTDFEVFYQCYRLGTIIGSKKESLELPDDTQVTSTIDAFPESITTYNDTTIEVGDKLTLNPDVDDDSDNITTTYDFFDTGTFSLDYSAYFDDVGEFAVTVNAFDGYHTITVTFVVTVIDPANAIPDESSSSIDDPIDESSSETVSSNATFSSTIFSSSSIITLSSALSSNSSSELINSSSSALSSSSQLSSIESPSSSLESSSSNAPRTYNIAITTNGSCGSVTNSNGYTYTEGSGSLAILYTMESYCSVQFTSDDVNFLNNFITGLTPTGLSKAIDIIELNVTFSDVAIPSANISIECYLDGTLQACGQPFGTVSPVSFTLYENNNSQTLATAVNSGFSYGGLTAVQNVTLNANDVSYVTAGTHGTVRADYSRETYQVTIQSGANGSVSKSIEPILHDIETTLSINTTAVSGYTFDQWIGKSGCNVTQQSPLKATCTQQGVLEAEFIPIPVTGIALTASEENVILNGNPVQLSYIITPSIAPNQAVTWMSLNTSVATVSSSGIVTAKNIGTIGVVVTTNDGSFKDTCDIIIDSFYDERGGGTTYGAVKIENQIWMAENLNYDFYDHYSSWCYEDNSTRCNTYGRVYVWATAATSAYHDSSGTYGITGSDTNPSNMKGICPTNWHLPSTSEWQELTSAVGSNNAQFYLQSHSSNTGFSAKLGGGHYYMWAWEWIGEKETWWTSDRDNYNRTGIVTLTETEITTGSYDYEYLKFYVRCVKN